MPVHTPGRRAGSGAALRQVKRAMQLKTSRTLYASLNLTSMVDFMSVVVIFLLMNFSASGDVLFMQKDIVLPEGQVSAQLERVPVIAISDAAVTVEGTAVESSQQILSFGDQLPLSRLKAALTKEKEIFKETHPGQQFDHRAIVQGHEEVPYSLVRRVVDAAADVGYTKLLFAVRRPQSK